MSRRSIDHSQVYEDTNRQTGRSRLSRASFTLTASIKVDDDDDGVQELKGGHQSFRVKSTEPEIKEAYFGGDVHCLKSSSTSNKFHSNQKSNTIRSLRGKSASSSPQMKTGNLSCKMTPTGKLTRIDQWAKSGSDSVEKLKPFTNKSKLARAFPKALGISTCVAVESGYIELNRNTSGYNGSKIVDEDDSPLTERMKQQKLLQLDQKRKSLQNKLRVLEQTSLANKQEEEELQRKKKEEALNQQREKARQQQKIKMLKSAKERSKLLGESSLGQEIEFEKQLPPIEQMMPPTLESLKRSFGYFAGIILSEQYFSGAKKHRKQIPDEFYDGKEYIDCMMPLFSDETLCQVEQRLEVLMKEMRDGDRKSNTDKDMEDREGAIVPEQPPSESRFIRSRLAQPRADKDSPVTVYDMTGMLAEEDDYEVHTLVIISNVAEPDVRYINRPSSNSKWVILGLVQDPDKKRGTKRVMVSQQFDDLLSNNKHLDMYIRKLEKLSSSLREMKAILSIESLMMVKGLLRPNHLTEFTKFIDKEGLLAAGQWLKTAGMQFNESQRWAIESVVSMNKGIKLLQGPPGTGKTHTLIGILSAVYHQLKSLPPSKDPNVGKRFMIVCAPSNAAVDEVVLRLSRGGLIGVNGEAIKVKVVRLGLLDKNRHEEVKKCSAEELAKDELAKKCAQINPGETAQQALFRQQNLDAIEKEIESIDERLTELKATGNEGGLTYRQMLARRQTLNSQVLEKKFKGQDKGELLESSITKVLNDADVVCCTLNTAGSDKLDRYVDRVAAVIIDEACQATEPSTLIPFRFQSPRVVLVGDPRQLAATIFSQNGKSTKYSRSMFERLADSKVPVEFLDTQYRMLPEISSFSCDQFYGGMLKDSEDRKSRRFPDILKGIQHNNTMFIDLKYGKERRKGHSFVNDDESRFVVAFLDMISKCCPHMSMGRVGVVAPYKAQVQYLRYKLEAISPLIEVNTVDAFQGQEKDILVFTCVRSRGENGQAGGGLGFLRDPRRLNVAITRAKYGLYVIGSSDVLKEDPIWNNLLCYFNKIERCKIFSHESSTKPFLEDFKLQKRIPHDKISPYPPTKPENHLNYQAAILEHTKYMQERKKAEIEYLGKRAPKDGSEADKEDQLETESQSEDEDSTKQSDFLKQKIALGLLPSIEEQSKSASRGKGTSEKRLGLKDLFSSVSQAPTTPPEVTSVTTPEEANPKSQITEETDLERQINEYSKLVFKK